MKVKDLSDGTICYYCEDYILTKMGLDYKVNGKTYCCKECADYHIKVKSLSTDK